MRNMVSIIIPIYNRQSYIEECIDSICASSYSDYEIILIDNIQILKTKNQTVLNDLDYIANELKRIAKENNLIVFLTSQISRQVEKRVNKVPKLIDLKNTSCLEEVSDVVIMLYRENYYDLKCDNNNAQICILKNNFGNVGYTELEFKYGFFFP